MAVINFIRSGPSKKVSRDGKEVYVRRAVGRDTLQGAAPAAIADDGFPSAAGAGVRKYLLERRNRLPRWKSLCERYGKGGRKW
jgi:hypothetical protein